MAFLIRTIDFTSSGREIVRDRELAQDALTIGRASENDIHLPDLAVEQRHVSLRETDDGMIKAEAIGGLNFGIDGRSELNAIIDPGVGAELSLGSARLAISREGTKASGAPIQIVIKQVEKDAGAHDALAGFQLASTLPSKRVMAWGFSLVILVLLLSVPIITHLTRDPVENDPEGETPGQVLFDAAWSTGELSMAHHTLEDNCESCHSTPFVSVQDETCLTCHEEIANHAEMPRQRLGMPPMSQGDAIQWSIAETLGKEGPLGCVSCHTEHEGPTRLEAASEQFCADCHGELDARLTDVGFGNADNFGDRHPQFRPYFFTAHFSDEPVRVSLDAQPVEMSGLVFPHDIHMDDQSGVARMAISLPQYGAPLECSDCHAEWGEEALLQAASLTDVDVTSLGEFAPVEMEEMCEACHSLVSGRSGAGFTSLRHGDVDDLMEDLAALDRGPRQPVTSGRQRPGQFARGGTYYSDFGRPMSGYIAINRALAPGGLCTECHLPTTRSGRPDLIPVNLPARFLMHGYFNHAAHEDEDCTDCHMADTSDEATDLLIPDLESCQECHKGEAAIETDEIVPSSCAMCHGYHTPTMPWRPEDHDGLPGNGGRDSVAAILGSLRR